MARRSINEHVEEQRTNHFGDRRHRQAGKHRVSAPAEARIQVARVVRDSHSKQARELVRHGGEVFQGNLDDPDSLMRAMDGVYGVFSVQPFRANEIPQGVAVIEAARRPTAEKY